MKSVNYSNILLILYIFNYSELGASLRTPKRWNIMSLKNADSVAGHRESRTTSFLRSSYTLSENELRLPNQFVNSNPEPLYPAAENINVNAIRRGAAPRPARSGSPYFPRLRYIYFDTFYSVFWEGCHTSAKINKMLKILNLNERYKNFTIIMAHLLNSISLKF